MTEHSQCRNEAAFAKNSNLSEWLKTSKDLAGRGQKPTRYCKWHLVPYKHCKSMMEQNNMVEDPHRMQKLERVRKGRVCPAASPCR